ncbi:MAG: acetyl-CoA hydrolase/transferase C-terminal domain-containing protein, partial [Evtepia gabavorous]
VDLIGQVAADAISADKIFRGAGGFVDFVRGASFSKGGKSIIAMPSTAMGGKASRIVDQFEAGRPVTLSRFETHYVVTEYGIAQLRGKTLRQRAQALIAIAHPSFGISSRPTSGDSKSPIPLTEKAPFPCNFGKGAFLSAPPFQLRL